MVGPVRKLQFIHICQAGVENDGWEAGCRKQTHIWEPPTTAGNHNEHKKKQLPAHFAKFFKKHQFDFSDYNLSCIMDLHIVHY